MTKYQRTPATPSFEKGGVPARYARHRIVQVNNLKRC